MKKKAIVVIKPKLFTAMTKTKKLERYKLLSKKRMIASPQTNFFLHRHAVESSTTSMCT